MTPTQRAAAERLAKQLDFLTQPFAHDAADLLRELAAEPAQAPDLVRDFPAVKAAKKAAEAELGYYREMMAAEPVQEPVAWIVPRAYGSGLSFTKLTKPENWSDDYGEWYCKPLYAAPQQRRPLTPSMQAEVECDCLVAWNASTYGHSAQDTVHPMFLSAFLRGYRAAERAHGITGEPT